MRTEKYFSLIAGGFGGLLSGLGLLNGWIVFVWIGIALLWLASRENLAGFLWGFVAVLVSHCWLLALHPLAWIGIPAQASLPLVIAIWISCGIIAGLLVGLWTWFGNCFIFLGLREGSFWERLAFVLVLSCVWGLGEVLLAHYPLFWIGIGGSVLPGDRFLAGLARWIGAGGLACVQLLIGFWLAQFALALSRGIAWRKPFFLGLFFVLLAHLIGSSLLSRQNLSATIPVAIWQPDIPIRTKFSIEQQNRLPKSIQQSLDRAKDLSATWLVSPEGMLNANQELLSPTSIPFLTGGFRWLRGAQRSSLLVFESGEKRFSAAIDKHRLVPLGEKLPDLSYLSNKTLSAVGGLEPGDSDRLLLWSGPPVAVGICYELSDGHAISQAVKGGAEWILALANLDPYPISLQRQFISLAQLRSIETSRDLISVANTGPSALVSASGEVEIVVPPFREGVELVQLKLEKSMTGYTLWQETPLIGLLLISLLGPFLLRLWAN